jgi:aminopeptidase N
MLKSHQFPEDAGPLAHPVRPASYIEINNFYTATVYEKGAELCRMLQTLLGRDGFRKGLDLYFDRHDGEAATVEDFVAAMADTSGRDLSQFMLWYNQAGTPELACSLDYDARSKKARLSVNQIVPPTPGQARKEPMPIPLKLGLLGSNGDDLPLELDDGTKLSDGLVEVTEREQTFTFRNVPTAPTPSLLRDFSAPVRLNISLDPDQIEFLMMHDSDPFNRWQAAQSYATNLLTAAARDGGSAEPVTGKEAIRLAQALGTTATETSLSTAYHAEFLRLPSESDIARELGKNVDPDAVRKAYVTLRATVGRKIQPALAEIYDAAAMSGPFSPDAESAGKRALRSAILDLLAGTGERSEIDRALRHYREASNMTDAIAALSILSHLEARDEVLADFYRRWQDEPLVLDKWFAVQARATRPDSVETVQGLLSHPKFSLKNPNRVRALIGSFVNGNPTGFNRADGAGYEFLASSALQIDRFNPHMAARLLGAFESWRTLEPRRQALAKSSLRQLASSQLSTDSYEIVTKTLGAD